LDNQEAISISWICCLFLLLSYLSISLQIIMLHQRCWIELNKCSELVGICTIYITFCTTLWVYFNIYTIWNIFNTKCHLMLCRFCCHSSLYMWNKKIKRWGILFGSLVSLIVTYLVTLAALLWFFKVTYGLITAVDAFILQFSLIWYEIWLDQLNEKCSKHKW